MIEKSEVDPKLVVEEIAPRLLVMKFLEISKDNAHNVTQAKYFGQHVVQAFQKHPGEKIQFLIDTTQVREARLMSKEARQMYLGLYANAQVGKVAFIGLGRWLRQMIRLFTQITGRWANSRIFKTKEDAITWLQNE